MPSDFFKQRSFEVVWAVFRVAAHISRPQLKKGLEDAALTFMASKTLETIIDLEYSIRLSQEIEEISVVNAGVLLREIGGLKKILSETAQEKMINEVKIEGKEKILIEEMFSKPPMVFAEFAKMIAQMSTTKKQEDMGNIEKSGNTEIDDVGVKPSHINAGQKSPAMLVKEDYIEEKKSGNVKIGIDGVNTVYKETQQKSPAMQNEQKVSKTEDVTQKGAYFSERQEIIIDLLKKRTLCHIKDILDLLPGISDRTLRYDIQKLVDKKLIERVGTGGPKSFLRIKRQKFPQ